MPSADRVKLIHFQQLFTDGNNVDGLAFIVELHHCLEDDLVAALIKHLFAVITEYLDNLFNRVVFEENTGQYLLLNLRGIGGDATLLAEIDIGVKIYGSNSFFIHRFIIVQWHLSGIVLPCDLFVMGRHTLHIFPAPMLPVRVAKQGRRMIGNKTIIRFPFGDFPPH